VNVLALVNSHAAAALQYGIERDFANRTAWVLLYDMGAASTEAALVRFSSFALKEYGKTKTYRRAARPARRFG
jgi:hypoxia up-regulated 1